MIKADEPIVTVQVEDNTIKTSKDADDIQFGSSRPTFGARPMFNKGKNEKIVNAEEFPDLGGAVVSKAEIKKNNAKSSNGPPKFASTNKNMFEGLKNVVEQNPAGKPKDEITREKREDRPYRPREEKDEFFGNFRSTNKDIKPKESDPKEESGSTPTFSSRPSDDSGKPKFNFTNNKKGAMTMAKQGEEAKKLKDEQEKNKKPESEVKKEDSFRNKNDENNKFERKAPTAASEKSNEKPKSWKPKAPKEKDEVEDNGWTRKK
jgi:hypothetical protein